MTDVHIPEPGLPVRTGPSTRTGTRRTGELIGVDVWTVFALGLDGGIDFVGTDTVLFPPTGVLELRADPATLKYDFNLIIVVDGTAVLALDGGAAIVNPYLIPEECTELDPAVLACAELDLVPAVAIELSAPPAVCVDA